MDYSGLKVQERNTFCLCSALQAIFSRHNLSFTQEEIAQNLTPSELGFIPNDGRIKDFFMRNGLDYKFFWHDETPFNERDSVLREMSSNQGMIGFRNHVYLLEEFSDPLIEIVDPKDRKLLRTNLYSLSGIMNRFDGFFGIVKYMS